MPIFKCYRRNSVFCSLLHHVLALASTDADNPASTYHGCEVAYFAIHPSQSIVTNKALTDSSNNDIRLARFAGTFYGLAWARGRSGFVI